MKLNQIIIVALIALAYSYWILPATPLLALLIIYLSITLMMILAIWSLIVSSLFYIGRGHGREEIIAVSETKEKGEAVYDILQDKSLNGRLWVLSSITSATAIVITALPINMFGLAVFMIYWALKEYSGTYKYMRASHPKLFERKKSK